MKFSEEHRKKMSETRKKLFKEGKIISYWKGKEKSEEHRKKISNSLKMGGYEKCDCGKEFYVAPLRRKRTIKRYCSESCKKIYYLPWNKEKKCPQIKEGLRKHYLKYESILKGIKRPTEVCEKISKSRLEDKNPTWKGDNVGYDALHGWIRSRKIKPINCEQCKHIPPYDLANISGKYKRDVNDFEWLCRKCHMEKDGRINKLYEGLHKNANT